MSDFVSRQWLIDEYHRRHQGPPGGALKMIEEAPADDVVEEENILKFYYVRSIDEYWIGRRVDNFYYAEYDSKVRQWVWTHSRYLPWGEHIISTTSLWKEHTYPSKPEEIPFADWLQGFIRKHIAVDVEPVKHGYWYLRGGRPCCSVCNTKALWKDKGRTGGFSHEFVGARSKRCPECGARMDKEAKDAE